MLLSMLEKQVKVNCSLTNNLTKKIVSVAPSNDVKDGLQKKAPEVFFFHQHKKIY